MLNKKEQRKFIQKRGANIVGHLAAFSREQDPESLHQLRVEIKKLKGFLALSAHCTGKQKLTKESKQVFKQAGAIRTAQLNLEFIQQYRLKDARFKKEQESIVLGQSREFSASAKKYSKTIRKNITSIADNLKPIHDKCIEGWYKESLRDLKKVFLALNIEELHEGRKTIKNLLHVHGMLHKSLLHSLNLNIEYLEKLQEAVGKWHDVVDSYDMLVKAKSRNKKVLPVFEKEISASLEVVKKMAADFPSLTKLKAPRRK